MKIRIITVLSTVFAVAVGFGQTTPIRGDTPEDAELSGLVNTVRSAPPEFAADGLISLVASGKIRAKKEKIDILREAFQLAGRAQEPVEMKLVYTSGLYISVQRSFAYGLDKASLRARVVKALLPLDANLARQLFEQIGSELPPSGSDCGDAYTYNPALYYSVLQEIVNSSADSAEAQRLLLAEVYKVSSIAQVRPLAKLLANVHVGEDILLGLVLAYGQRLSKLTPDVSQFSAEFQGAIEAIRSLADKLPPAARGNLIQNTRSFIVASVGRGVCRGRTAYALQAGEKKAIPWRDPVVQFNDRLASLGVGARPIEPGDVSVSILATAPLGIFSPGWQELSRMLTLLANDSLKDSPRWKNEMEKLISAVSNWNEDEGSDPESENRFFLEKSNLLQSILNLSSAQASALGAAKSQAEYDKLNRVPKADILGRGRAQSAFVALLESKLARTVYGRRRIVWYAAISEVIRQYDRSEEPVSLLTQFTSSRDPVLVMYGKLYKALDVR